MLGSALLLFGCSGYWKSTNTGTASFVASHANPQVGPIEIEARVLNGTETNDAVLSVLRKKRMDFHVSSTNSRVCTIADWGVLALNANDSALASEFLDEATTIAGSVTVAGEREKRVTSLTGAESGKIFKGEPHERVVMYLHRGLLYLAEGDYENAHACFLNAAMQNSMAHDRKDRSSWLTIDLLILWCDRLMASNSADEVAADCQERYRAEFLGNREVFDPKAGSALILLAVGRPPQKTTILNKDKTINLSYSPNPSKVTRVAVTAGGTSRDLPLSDDVFVQAETRGRRNMDAILTKKGSAKRMTEGAAQGVATVGVIGGNMIPGLGILTAIIADSAIKYSANINTGADIREMYCVPGKYYMAFVDRSQLASGVTIQAFDSDSKLFAEKTIKVPDIMKKPMIVTGLLPF